MRKTSFITSLIFSLTAVIACASDMPEQRYESCFDKYKREAQENYQRLVQAVEDSDCVVMSKKNLEQNGDAPSGLCSRVQ